MQKITFKAILIISLLAIFLFFPLNLKACELKIRVMHYPPLAIKQQDNTWQGLDIDYSQLLLNQINCTAQYLEMPFSRGLRMLELGKVDMMLNMTKTAQREKYFHFIGPYRNETLSLITHKSLPNIKTWKQLSEISATLAIQRGIVIGKHLSDLLDSKAEFAKNIVYVADNEARIGLVNKKRVMGFFDENSYLAYQLNNNPLFSQMKIHTIKVQSVPVYMAISKNKFDAREANKLQRALDFLILNNKLTHIENNYVIKKQP